MEKPISPRGKQNQPHPSDRIKLNVGGRLFETTVSTAHSAGPDSLLATLSTSDRLHHPVFIDRDPDIFSVLLSVLRSSRLPSSSFSRQELLLESSFYGLESSLRSALSAPPLSGIDASLSSTVVPASDGFVSAFTASDDDGSLWMAHGGQISTFDSVLVHSSTVRTHLDAISSICRVSPKIAAIRTETAAGVHFYDTGSGRLAGSAYWTDQSDPRIYKSSVAALADSGESVAFASMECRHWENAVVVIDKSTLGIVSEIGRQSGNSTKYGAAGKLRWAASVNLLVGSSVTSGAFGCAGYIRIWDPRSGEMVWETSEPGSGRSSRFGDVMADADVDVEESRLVKVCSKSGDLGMADIRYLKGEDPWVYLEDPNPVMKGGHGYGRSVVHCYRSQVFVGREEGLEVWSRLEPPPLPPPPSASIVSHYRRNFVDKPEHKETGVITRMEGGGNRLFICRYNVEGVQVWETSPHSGLLSFT